MAYADSAAVTGGIKLPGVWIHDPLDPEGTTRVYPFGADSREHAVDIDSAGTQYAGREFPVVDYGEGSTQTETIRIVVPHGPDYQERLEELDGWARARRTLHLRDNRGRSLRGTMGGLRATDQGYGSDVSFTFNRVHVVPGAVVV
jgi:hypothetical protein